MKVRWMYVLVTRELVSGKIHGKDEGQASTFYWSTALVTL